jgi:hypothetical protein
MENNYSSPALIKEMENIFGEEAKVIKIQMKHEKEIKKYLQASEFAFKKAASSKLKFD